MKQDVWEEGKEILNEISYCKERKKLYETEEVTIEFSDKDATSSEEDIMVEAVVKYYDTSISELNKKFNEL